MKKLLVFAHVPPPAHGQSLQVLWMLEGLRQAGGVEVIHVDCRVSDGLDDVGSVRAGKLTRLLGYCRQAIRARFRDGVRTFYYVPAPGKRSALYRDWIVMALCRPFFPRVIFHWHAMGLGEWLEKKASAPERWITRLLMGRPALSIITAEANREGVAWWRSERVEVVSNGVPDPWGGGSVAGVLAERRARLEERRRMFSGEEARVDAVDGPVYHLLFMALCTREKGLFDAVEGVIRYNASNPRVPARLKVAGGFANDAERQEFEALVKTRGAENAVEYVGFVSGEEKARLFREADAFCFPTYYQAESFGLVIVEAMAAGCLPIVTRWRAIPELLPPDYPGFVAPREPAAVAEKIGEMQTYDLAGVMRAGYEARFTLERHLERLREVLEAELERDLRRNAGRRQGA